MEIDSALAGTVLKEYSVMPSWRDTMNYAAATGDTNPWYLDDEREGGVIAPPMYAVAATWPITAGLAEHFESSGYPAEIALTGVHYTEHLQFHQPLKPGEQLVIKGRVAAIMPHNAGTLLVLRYDALNDADETIFTEYIGSLLRGVQCADGGKGERDLPTMPACRFASPFLWEASLPVDPLQPYLYDGCIGIVFPIHTSFRFAREVGLPGIILQGTATLAYAVRELINREADGDPRALKEVSCRFTGMVRPGTNITVQLLERRENRNARELFFAVFNESGTRAISDGCGRVARGHNGTF